MIEIRKSLSVKRLINDARNIEGAEGRISAAGFLVAVIDWIVSGKCDDEVLETCVRAFLHTDKTDILFVREIFLEYVKKPQLADLGDDPVKYNEVYIKTVVEDAELMAEKDERDVILPKDLFLCIILRPDRVIRRCLETSES